MSISKLYFRGHDTSEFTGVTVASCDYGDLESKRADEDIAGADGTLAAHANGRHYKARQMTIVFNIKATPTTVEATIGSVLAWLSEGAGELSDDFNSGKVWQNCEFVSAHTDYIDMFRGCAQLTVKMTADPLMQPAGSVNERVVGFSANGNAALTVTNNASYSINGGTAVSFTVQPPYTYRLVAYSENPAAATLNGTALALDTPFTMPAAAEIVITHTGFGWYELIHDTRQAVST